MPRLKKPPYANQLDLPKQNRCLIVYTGGGAWNAARRPFGYNGYFVVLPFDHDPALYDWRCAAGCDALILGFGEHEPLAVIAKLGGLLLAAGATLVIYAPEGGLSVRIDARRAAA